jgi:hypothetical protein
MKPYVMQNLGVYKLIVLQGNSFLFTFSGFCVFLSLERLASREFRRLSILRAVNFIRVASDQDIALFCQTGTAQVVLSILISQQLLVDPFHSFLGRCIFRFLTHLSITGPVPKLLKNSITQSFSMIWFLVIDKECSECRR